MKGPKITFPAVKRIRDGREDQIAFDLPPGLLRDNLWMLITIIEQAGKDRLQLSVGPPFKPRTTGPKSQNHAINGCIQALALQSGEEFDALKQYLKRKAIRRGWGFDTLTRHPDAQRTPQDWAELIIDVVVGTNPVTLKVKLVEIVQRIVAAGERIVPHSEAKASTAQAAGLIEEIIQYASESGYWLPPIGGGA